MSNIIYPNYHFIPVVNSIGRFTNNLEFRDKVARQNVQKKVDDAGKEFKKIFDREVNKYAKN